MEILDNLKQIKELDKLNLLGSIQKFPDQLEQTWNDLQSLELPSDYHNVNKIVINGMGGSRLGARVAQYLFSDSLDIPIIPVGTYKLPSYVDQNTLLILSSYSGDTEEILSTYAEAKERKAKILIFSQDGKLGKIASQDKMLGYYNFTQESNPCRKPRMGIGYQILGILLLLSKTGHLSILKNEIQELIDYLKNLNDLYGINTNLSDNQAKKLATTLHEKIILLIGAEFLTGALHVFRNLIHENSKQLACYFEIPELNHHLMESLSFPSNNKNNLAFVILKSKLYLPQNQKRILMTENVLEKTLIPFNSIELRGQNKLTQVFELIQLGAYVSFYLAILNNVDPSPIPMVDLFKKMLEETK